MTHIQKKESYMHYRIGLYVDRMNVAINAAEIIRAVEMEYSISREMLGSPVRYASVIQPRYAAWYLMYKYIPLITLKSIGSVFSKYGGKTWNHSTVLHCIRAIEGWMETDERIRNRIHRCSEMIEGRTLIRDC